ncbi:MAG TPA: putative metal-binding motif-containing protein [Polyangiaceae bacterium]
MRLRSASLLVAVPLLAVSACGRTGVWQLLPDGDDGGKGGRGGSGGKSEPECSVDADCPVIDACAPPVCVMSRRGARCETRPIDCDDGNACTLDRCNPDVGVCEHAAPEDLDGDGYVGTAPAGAPASCGGADCDDEDSSVHPGAADVCNGKDDDCDGAVDDEQGYRLASSPVELAPELGRTQHGGIAWSGEAYGVTFTFTSESFHKQSYFGLLDFDGTRVKEPARVSEINADTYAGPVAWSGESFLTAWADARQASNYEIYATRFDRDARELSPDQRLTDAYDFSLRPSLRYTGSEYLMVWDDHRFEDSGGALAIYGRRISTGGVALGGEIRLTSEGESAEYAALALGPERAGVAYVVNDGDDFANVRFRSFDHAFSDGGAPIELTNDGQEPSLVRVNRDQYVAAWHTGSEARNFGSAIEAVLLDSGGSVLVRRTVTSGDVFAKWRTLVSLGDRVVLVWSGAGPDGVYALYYELLSASDLSPLSPRQLLATSSLGGVLIDPVATLGDFGDIGVLYDDNRSGVYRAYFVRLTCQLPLR